METYKIENLSFSYPESKDLALDKISLTIRSGEMLLICGRSGCGKSTLLRLLKSVTSPNGVITGNIAFCGKELSLIGQREQASEIGIVMQDPENQAVTDKVWHELAFGLESLGLPTSEIRSRVAETASFFGLHESFHRSISELSGGQKQLLNLASVMAMHPSVLILDEPTSRLDPIAAQEFLNAVKKVNLELGTTVIIAEHRLEDILPFADRVAFMENGRITVLDTPREIGKLLCKKDNDAYLSLPTAMRVYGEVENGDDWPISVGEGRRWLDRYKKNHGVIYAPSSCTEDGTRNHDTAIELKSVYFRYEKEDPDVIRGLDMHVFKGEFFAVLGSNGVGKSTTLSLICGINTPQRGKILINGEDISHIDTKPKIGILMQDPKCMLSKKTVYSDLASVLPDSAKNERDRSSERINEIARLCKIEHILNCHPYDISGGEQQRAALAKVLLSNPEILLLDEPTKGLDARAKADLAKSLSSLCKNGTTIVMVTHDIEFCAEYADRCAMFFDGAITSCAPTRDFFLMNNYYTTSACRMSRGIVNGAVTADDIISCLKKRDKDMCRKQMPTDTATQTPTVIEKNRKDDEKNEYIVKNKPSKSKRPIARVVIGSIFVFLLTLTLTAQFADHGLLKTSLDTSTLELLSIIEAAAALFCLLPKKASSLYDVKDFKSKRKISKLTLLVTCTVLVTIPLTIFSGMFFFGDRKYYLISILIIIQAFIPFIVSFEGRRPQAREIALVSVLCAVAVASRAAFFMLPQFKPVSAIIILTGICLGCETGFLIGAVTGFVSNFFFGQGPWTPWQMLAFGMLGFVGGIFSKTGRAKRSKISLCIFGFFAVLIIYGGIINPSTVLQTQSEPTLPMIIAAYVSGLPFDLIHALSCAFFLWFISKEMIEKLERLKTKYGFMR